MERLHQTHDSLRAYRPAGGVEAILGRTTLTEGPEGVVAEGAAVPEPARPWWLTLVNTGEVPRGTFVADRVMMQPRWPADGLVGSEPEPVECVRSPRRPLNLYEMYKCGFAAASAVALELGTAKALGSLARALAEGELVPMEVAMGVAMDPAGGLLLEVIPDVYEMEPEVEEEDRPPFAKLLTLPRVGVREIPGAPSYQLLPVAIVLRAQLPLDAAMRHATLAPAALLHAGLRHLPMDRIPLAQAPWIDSLRALDLHAEREAPMFTISTPPARPRLRLASGRRYAVETQPGIAPAMAPETAALATRAPGISLPKRKTEVRAAASAQMHEPEPAGMVSLAGIAHPSGATIEMRQMPKALSLPQPARTEPIRPMSKLEPMDVRPAFDLSSTMPPMTAEMPGPAPRPEPTGHERANIWIHAVDFWNRAPRDLKMLTFAIPVLLGLALHPSLPKVRVAAPAKASGLQRNFQRAVNEQFVNVRQTVLDRAAVALDEDFRSGLDDWASPGDASTDWSFDATGFVKPGPLAIYRPSMSLTDYQVQFLGMIDKKAMSWVVRAADFQNFYVVKLVVLKPGPLPSIGLTRYAVVNGKADARVDTVVPVDAREDMLYRVRLDVHDNDFSLTVQGQMVDAWSEPRLKRGGIGFFSAKGEESRLRWVQVTHQYDMLGRLCAYLAPYNFSNTSNGITSTSGSWQP